MKEAYFEMAQYAPRFEYRGVGHVRALVRLGLSNLSTA
jgi:hypothetical protein